jgi:hypothetical protein
MAFGGLKVEADEPGRRLVLAGSFPSIPKNAILIVGAIVVLLFGVPAIGSLLTLIRSGFSIGALIDLAVSAFFPVTVMVVLLTLARGVRIVSRLSFDRAGDRIEIKEFRLIGAGRDETETIPFADLRGMLVSAASRPGRGTGSQPVPGLGVNVKLLFREETGQQPRQLALAVDGLDKIEEASDLALRLASVARFEYQRVLRSDPRGLEVEFGTLGAQGFFPMPESVAVGKADYAHDQVSQPAQAIAAHESTPPFDPARFKSEFRPLAWLPGQEVRFKRSLGLPAIGCAPGMLLLLAGPLVFVSMGPGHSLGDRIMPSLVVGVFGLIFGGLAAAAVYTSLPRTVTFDWMARKLTIRGAFRQSDYDFADIRTLELKGVKFHHSPKSGGSYWTYASALVANLGALGVETHAIELLQTDSFREDPDAPYRMALPLVTDLAAALGVKRVITDYS